MVIKLIKIDSTEAAKITLSIGSHLFGRGKLLNVEDKRVSRKHGELIVNEDKLIVKALHQNPCFYKKDKSDIQVLKCDCEVDLSNGDRFGLLPDSHWFEIIIHPTNEQDAIESEEVHEQENTENYDETVDGTVCNERSDSPVIDLQQVNFVSEMDNPAQTTSNEHSNTIEDTNTIENDMSVEDASTEENETTVENPPAAEPPAVETTPENSGTDAEEPKSPQKRSHSPEEDNAKRVKLEPSDVKQEPVDVNPGPSDSGNANANNNGMPPSPQKQPNNLRERCYYGARCYRRNPLHMAQFSHPKDPDWGTGDKGECPYGANCSKPHQKHWDTHNHPPGVCRPVNQGVCVQRNGKNIYIRANTVNIYDDHIEAEDSDGDSVDIDYEY
ncbi:aprataxin and PNK-like factor isoform X2 [Zerene cesonia]|uniref:aprataxin and PNK-like factor isoform X2 n=1 Tax=Zerene cesonia TaxID=33412 RepID=UPI0018E5294B|nr:aprataxin and PNK-like factor isoform X2 [Zerene cesonia]